MTLRSNSLSILAAMLACASLAQAGGLSDAAVQQKKGALDAKLINRVERIKKEVEKRGAFQEGLAKERQDFETHMAEEHRAFMGYLLSVLEPDRAKVLGQFEDKQQK